MGRISGCLRLFRQVVPPLQANVHRSSTTTTTEGPGYDCVVWDPPGTGGSRTMHVLLSEPHCQASWAGSHSMLSRGRFLFTAFLVQPPFRDSFPEGRWSTCVHQPCRHLMELMLSLVVISCVPILSSRHIVPFFPNKYPPNLFATQTCPGNLLRCIA